jgi:polyferredoxin
MLLTVIVVVLLLLLLMLLMWYRVLSVLASTTVYVQFPGDSSHLISPSISPLNALPNPTLR